MTATGLVEALHVAGPAGPTRPSTAAVRAVHRLVGHRLVGPRRATARTVTARGELHFGWVLGGRAVQDIWIVPGRGEPGEGEPPLAFHGSTHPLLRRGARRLALDLDRPGQRPRAALRRPAGGRRDRAAQRRGRSAAALALHRHRAGLVHLAGRDLPRRRRDVDARRGDADHARGHGVTAPARRASSCVRAGATSLAESTRVPREASHARRARLRPRRVAPTGRSPPTTAGVRRELPAPARRRRRGRGLRQRRPGDRGAGRPHPLDRRRRRRVRRRWCTATRSSAGCRHASRTPAGALLHAVRGRRHGP